MLSDFKSSFTRLSEKFVARYVLYFPLHIQRVAILPCEKHNSKNSEILTYLTQYHHFALLLTKLTTYKLNHVYS